MNAIASSSPRADDALIASLLSAALASLGEDQGPARDWIQQADRLLRPVPTGHVHTGGLPSWAAERVAAYIEHHMANTVRIEHVAKLARLSKSHFGRAFKETFGVPFLQFLVTRRIERAKSLMVTTKDNLCEIALACGFADQAHFSRTFRRIVGATPNAWRRQRAIGLSFQAARAS